MEFGALCSVGVTGAPSWPPWPLGVARRICEKAAPSCRGRLNTTAASGYAAAHTKQDKISIASAVMKNCIRRAQR
jgi:hypothetical protein